MREYLSARLKSIHRPLLHSAPAWRAVRMAALALLMAVGPTTVGLVTVGLGTIGLSIVRPAPVLAQTAPNCVDLIINGSFEQTATGWSVMPGSSLFAYATDQAVDGRQSLLLGFSTPLNIPATFGVEQLVTLPAESTSIDIGFAYAVLTEAGRDEADERDPDEGDQALLTIHDTANNQLLAMLVFSPSDGEWNLGRYDLTPLAGKEIRLSFLTQNDGEPGRLSMRVDDVSIVACLPPEAFALEALPTPEPTPLPPTPEVFVLTPMTPATPLPTAPPPSSGTGAGLPPSQMPPANEHFPPAALIESLAQCSCTSSLYACSSFASWAVAQACYTHCQVTAGYDIHNLDPDRNGVACELELQDVTPLDATPSPQPTPSTDVISETNTTDPAVSPVITGAVAVTGASETVVTGAMTLPVAAGVVTTNPVASTGTVTEPGTDTITDPVVVAAAPPSITATTSNAPALSPTLPTTPPGSALSPMEMLTLLLFSPLGYLAIGAIVVIGGLSLWVAFLLGQRGQMPKTPPAPNADPADSTPEDFALSSNKTISTRRP